MKIYLVLAMALAVSGCGSMNFFGDSNDDAPTNATTPVETQPSPPPANTSMAATASDTAQAGSAAQSAPASVAQAAPSSSAHCTALAKQRAIDAGFQGEDGDTQESVYNRTYSDCVAWDQKHNL